MTHIFLPLLQTHYILFKKFSLFIFRERGKREKEKERNLKCVVASHGPPTGDLAHNPGMCPDWELNLQPLVHRLVLNPLSHTSQGSNSLYS